MRICFLVVTLLYCFSCKPEAPKEISDDAYVYWYHKIIKKITDVIVHDIFSPPVASRIYAYTTIAGYETARLNDTNAYSFAKIIPHLPTFTAENNTNDVDAKMASLFAVLYTGQQLTFSEDSILKMIITLQDSMKIHGMSASRIKKAEKLGKEVSDYIIKWASGDNYLQSRSYPKYQVTNEPARWRPTPPGYMDAVEPAWSSIRPLLMDSVNMFAPIPPAAFNMEDKTGVFYKNVMEVYLTVKNISPEQLEIAKFWDCNPFALNITGHVMHAIKKISPGGHWINITGLACKKSDFNLLLTSETYALVSIGLFDAFISCWAEKFNSNVIRPETVINEYIDKDWSPVLQTPPFPEYTSGHSVASSSAAVILTSIFGNNFSFDDNTEVEFGLPVRSFPSFIKAAQEASISRLYGGIHYRPAIEQGIKQGEKVGQLVVSKRPGKGLIK